jgi:predicted MPP superfamily phosphohydrolase
MKAARSGKRTPSSRGRRKAPTRQDSSPVESLTWLSDLHLEFCSHRTRDRFYHSINQAPGEIVIITGDLSAGPHRLGQYAELAEQIGKPVYFVLGNHDRYGTTFANAEAVVELDFAAEPEPQVFRQMKERARKYSQALKPSLIKALKQYQTTKAKAA